MGKSAGVSPIRQIAMARPAPPQLDPILDYDTIFFNQDPVSRLLRAVTGNLYLAASVIGNRDVGVKRQGPLTLSRLPEVSINGNLPLVSRLPQDADNASLRRFLRVPRLQNFTELTSIFLAQITAALFAGSFLQAGMPAGFQRLMRAQAAALALLMLLSMTLSIQIAGHLVMITAVWTGLSLLVAGIAIAFYTDWPVSFCITALSALAYFAAVIGTRQA